MSSSSSLSLTLSIGAPLGGLEVSSVVALSPCSDCAAALGQVPHLELHQNLPLLLDPMLDDS